MKYYFATVLFFMLTQTAISSNIARFPSFEELQRAESLFDQGDIDSYFSLLERLSFSEDEIKSITDTNLENDLVIGIIFTFESESKKISYIEKALGLYPNSPIILFLAINHCAYEGNIGKYAFCNEDLYSSFLAANKNNIVAHYTLAAYNYENGNYENAIRYMKTGNKTLYFNGFTEEIFKIVRNKALHLKFPEYISNSIAFLNFVSIMYTRPIIGMCENEHMFIDKQSDSHCIVFGSKMEIIPKTMIEKLFGLSIQIKVFESRNTSARKLNIISERKKELSLISEAVAKIPKEKITLQDSASFYVDLFKSGEIEAFKKLRVRYMD